MSPPGSTFPHGASIMADWVRIAAADDCAPGQLKGVMAGLQPIVLANVDGDLYALEDQCSHQELPLSDG